MIKDRMDSIRRAMHTRTPPLHRTLPGPPDSNEPELKTNYEPKLELKPEPEHKLQPEPEPEPEIEAEYKAEKEIETEIQLEPQPELIDEPESGRNQRPCMTVFSTWKTVLW